MQDTVQAAIDEALKGNWQAAIELNKQILKENPTDVEALNRLGFAYSEIRSIKEAKRVYKKVLLINRFNPIAIKNLKRIELFTEGKTPNSKGKNPIPAAPIKQRVNHFASLFLEEVGKTKVVSLINLAEAKIISNLHSTDQVVLVPRRRGVAIITPTDEYIGALPDDIARRLFVLMKGGNTYEAYVKSVNRNEVSIFIRETKRQAKFRNQPSFLGKGSVYYTTVREEALQVEEKPDVSRLEDLEEEDTETQTDTEEEATT